MEGVFRRLKSPIAICLILLAILLSPLLFIEPETRGSLRCADCNIVFISIDATRPDHFGIYGYEKNITPNIDEFFRDKTVFTNAISSAPCTTPSVENFLAGKFNISRGSSFPEVLQRAGYETGAFVSQHTFIGGGGPMTKYSRGFDVFDFQNMSDRDVFGFTKRDAEDVIDHAIRWMDVEKGGKFFTWIHLYDPHDPYAPPERFRGANDDAFVNPDGYTRTRLMDYRNSHFPPEKRGRKDWRKLGGMFTEYEVETYRRLYDGEISYVDEQFARVASFLYENDLLDDTIVVVSADHGENLGEHKRWDHCQDAIEREIHVPLLFSVGGEKLGDFGKSSIAASTLDIGPTVLALTGVFYDAEDFDGKSLLDADENRKVFTIWGNQKVIKKGKWKLYYHNKSRETMLYNIEDDYWGEKDVGDKYPEIRDELMKELIAFTEGREDREYEDRLQRLQNLGYA